MGSARRGAPAADRGARRRRGRQRRRARRAMTMRRHRASRWRFGIALCAVVVARSARVGRASESLDAFDGERDGAVDALPTRGDDDDVVTRIRFGEKVAVDDLIGPVVINHDCTTKYIENWREMTEREREATRRRLGARNRERHAACKQKLGNENEL
jgi:hypothetical protein|tara:strand:+ start:3314 stop:3784 length:471 start_codon:yes stop_codon:yes gene_type:complete